MALPRPDSRHRAWPRAGIACLLLASIAWGLVTPRPACAQTEGVPTQSYHWAIVNLFYDGDYKNALSRFQSEWRSAVKAGQLRWIDSICYSTMMGECYYHMGDLPQALENYTAAVNLFLNYPDWMIRVRFSGIQVARASPQTPWGASTRGSQLGHYPTRTPMLQGSVDTSMRYKDGGMVQQPMMYPVEVHEIVRCTVLAIRRRAELLGPLSKYDALNRKVLTAVQQPITQRNHWSQAYADAELGVALLANGRDAQAATALTRAAVAQGQFDHHLTATVLLELGKLSLRQGNNPVAAKAFLEATYAAFHSEDLGVMEEAFRYASLAYLLANKKGVFPPLVLATPWAQTKNWRQLRASLLLSSAEGTLSAGQTPQGVALLDEATKTIANRTMAAGWIGARLHYLRSVAQFQARRVDLGEQSLAEALKYMQAGSHWLFHIAQVDGAVMSNALTSRNAVDLYQDVLREPQPADWAWDPLECLAVLVSPHPEAMERWFLSTLQRADRDAALATALEVSDRARRHRFFCTLALGGRLHALRWVLEAPADALDKKALAQRQDLLADFPAYQTLQQQVKQVQQRLEKMALAPQDAEIARQQSGLFADLGKLSLQQEAILREMAVRRVSADLLFPPLRPTEELQKAIPTGTAILAFFAAGNRLHGFLVNREKSTVWVVKRAPLLDKGVSTLLREMGNLQGNSQITLKDLAEPQWRQTARDVLGILLEGSQADLTKKFPELVIVPEGILWYLPFEALQVNVNDRLQPLLARFRIRYAPTLSLAVPDGRTRRLLPKTALALGRLYPREGEAGIEASYKEIMRAVPEAAVFRSPPLPASSALLKTQMGQLIVLDDLVPPDRGPYSWAPIQIDRGKPGNTLRDWLSLPRGGPDVVVLPGFRTPAENAMKNASRAAAGADVFLSVCGLMSAGARTILLSRWRSGGQSSVDLVREFTQELPRTAPADAWQRAVMVVAETPLDLDAEPRIKKSIGDEPPKVNHPFFCAGYVLVDSGVSTGPGDADEPKPPDGKMPKKGEAKPANGEGAKKADGDRTDKMDLGDSNRPAEAKQPAKPPEAGEPGQPNPDVNAPKPPPGKGRGKGSVKRGKAS